MAVNEQIVTGRKFRKLIDIVNKTWQRISFWTHSSDVEFEDGMTAETKVGAIDGITDSLVSTSSRIAASAKAVSELSNDLAQKPDFIYDSTGKITGYKSPGGADTVFPFNSGPYIKSVVATTSGVADSWSYNNYSLAVVICPNGASNIVMKNIGNGISSGSNCTFNGNVITVDDPTKDIELTSSWVSQSDRVSSSCSILSYS